MHLRIDRFGRHIHLCSVMDFQRALAAGEIEKDRRDYWDDWSASDFLRRHFGGAYEVSTLRSAIGSQTQDLWRMSDDDVIDAATHYLRSGEWRIGYDSAIAEVAPVQIQPATAPEDTGAPVRVFKPVTTKRAPASVLALTPDAGARPTVPPPEREWTDDVDQIAFAQVLEQAAMHAYPFCEICRAKLKRSMAEART